MCRYLNFRGFIPKNNQVLQNGVYGYLSLGEIHESPLLSKVRINSVLDEFEASRGKLCPF